MKSFANRLALSAIAIAVTATAAMAIPAKPGLITYTQPDGSTIEVRLNGDERHHFYTSSDGYVLLRGTDDEFRYAVMSDGELVASEMLAANPASRSAEARQLLATVNTAATFEALEAQAPKTRMNSPKRVAPEYSRVSFPVTGSPRTLVILVEFSNNSFTIANPLETYKRMMSEEGFSDAKATGSVLDFYKYSSNGQFTPQFDVYGPVKLTRTISYYGGNDYYGDDKAPHKMIIDACQLLDGQIDFTKYDTDNDGTIDNVYVFYAGYGEADGGASNTIWPHSWDVYSGAGESVYLDGKLLDHYATSMELSYSSKQLAGIGTFCHEFGHVLSLPDLYATSYTSAYTPGDYDLMDGGSYNNDSHTPPAMSGYERYCLGWTNPEELKEPADVTLRPISDGGYDDVKIIKTERTNEYFVLENRQKKDWDKYIPGHGMLIWHIDYSSSVWNRNTCNNNAAHQYIDIEEADNRQTSASAAGDTFPGTSKNTSFTDTTTPNMKSWSGRSLNKPITDITESLGLISFKFMGGGNVGVANIAAGESRVIGANGRVTLSLDSAADVMITDLAGRQVYAGHVGAGTTDIPAGRGVYIARIGAQVTKIIVK